MNKARLEFSSCDCLNLLLGLLIGLLLRHLEPGFLLLELRGDPDDPGLPGPPPDHLLLLFGHLPVRQEVQRNCHHEKALTNHNWEEAFPFN